MRDIKYRISEFVHTCRLESALAWLWDTYGEGKMLGEDSPFEHTHDHGSSSGEAEDVVVHTHAPTPTVGAAFLAGVSMATLHEMMGPTVTVDSIMDAANSVIDTAPAKHRYALRQLLQTAVDAEFDRISLDRSIRSTIMDVVVDDYDTDAGSPGTGTGSSPGAGIVHGTLTYIARSVDGSLFGTHVDIDDGVVYMQFAGDDVDAMMGVVAEAATVATKLYPSGADMRGLFDGRVTENKSTGTARAVMKFSIADQASTIQMVETLIRHPWRVG